MLAFPTLRPPRISHLLPFHRPSPSRPPFSIRLQHPHSATNALKKSPSPSPLRNLQPPKSPFFQRMKPVLTATCIFAAAIAALFFSSPLTIPAVAAPAVVSEAAAEHKRRHPQSHADEVKALTELLNTRLKSRDISETDGIVERLVELEPENRQWRVMMAHVRIDKGEMATASADLEKLLADDPLFVEAYHGLVLLQSHKGMGMPLLVSRIEGAMEMCRKQGKVEAVKDFKLLFAQISLLEGKYDEALMVYDELEKQDAEDFRPHVCRAIVYSLMGKVEETKKEFERYKELVPADHPFKNLFDENIVLENISGGGGGELMKKMQDQ